MLEEIINLTDSQISQELKREVSDFIATKPTANRIYHFFNYITQQYGPVKDLCNIESVYEEPNEH